MWLSQGCSNFQGHLVKNWTQLNSTCWKCCRRKKTKPKKWDENNEVRDAPRSSHYLKTFYNPAMGPFQPGTLCDPLVTADINRCGDLCLTTCPSLGWTQTCPDRCQVVGSGSVWQLWMCPYSFICQTTLLQLSLCLFCWRFSHCRASGWDAHCHCHRGGSSSIEMSWEFISTFAFYAL